MDKSGDYSLRLDTRQFPVRVATGTWVLVEKAAPGGESLGECYYHVNCDCISGADNACLLCGRLNPAGLLALQLEEREG